MKNESTQNLLLSLLKKISLQLSNIPTKIFYFNNFIIILFDTSPSLSKKIYCFGFVHNLSLAFYSFFVWIKINNFYFYNKQEQQNWVNCNKNIIKCNVWKANINEKKRKTQKIVVRFSSLFVLSIKIFIKL